LGRKNYCGLLLDWNYEKGYVDISVPEYVKTALHKFQHKPLTRPAHAPHQWSQPVYGKKVQFDPEPEQSDIITDPKTIKRLQSIVSTFLYYSHAVNCTMLPALNKLSTQQSRPTQETINTANTLLDFASKYPQAKIHFHASDIILHVDTDAAYLVMPNANGCIAGFCYLSSHPTSNQHPPINNSILVEYSTIKNVVSSAAEVESGGCYYNAQKAIPTYLHSTRRTRPSSTQNTHQN
jgi:hypothetical protein